jgi:biotin transport system substrate-specific component
LLQLEKAMSMTSIPARERAAESGGARFARRAALVALGVALITASAHVRIPMWPVPVTMQTFAVMMIGAAYGPALAGATVAAYLALGAAGVAVFAGGVGGAIYLTGPTAGYLVGFLFAALSVGALTRRGWDRTVVGMGGALLIGNIALYLCGLGWLSYLFAAEKGIGWVLHMGLFVFLPGDLLKLALGALLVPALRKAFSR